VAESRRLHEGALVGAFLGLADTLYAAATGWMPRSDFFWIWSFDLALGLGIGLVALTAGVLLRRNHQWLASAAIVAVPALLFALRGPLGRPSQWAQPGSLAALSIVLAPFVLLQPRWVAKQDAMTHARFALVAAAYLGGALFVLSQDLVRDELNRGRVLVAAVLILSTVVACVRSTPATTVGLTLSVAVAGGALLMRGAESASAALPISAATEPALPNVLLVTLDTVRADHVSSYGYSRPTSPSLDELTRIATRYTNAYATSPYTLSSHGSLFTGLLPSSHGARSVPFPSGDPTGPSELRLTDKHPTLAETLRRRGYDTGAIVANYAYLHPSTGLARGFESFDASPERVHGHAPLLASFLFRAGPALSPRLFLGWTKGAKEADAISDAAIAWLRRPRDRPFFLFLNYLDAHAPYAPPRPHARRFSKRSGLWVQLKWNLDRRLSAEDWEYLVDQYDASIAFVDEQLGRVLEFLRAAGTFDSTLIAVTSDHGEFLGEHGRRGHRQALYEPVLRIPMIVKGPQQRAQRSDARTTTLADLHWLIRETLEQRSPPEAARVRAVAEYWTPWGELRQYPSRLYDSAWRASYQDRFKLIETASRPAQLFDLDSDPGEQRDLATTPEGAQRVRMMLEALPPFLKDPSQRPAALDPDAERRLRALGYLR
jgi:arylsulfatase A-like enzyme